MDKVVMFDIGFDNFDFKDLMSYIDTAVSSREPSYMVTCNVDHLVKLKGDIHFRQVYKEAGVTLADGMPIVWASRLLGTPLKQRVAGSDILTELGYQFELKRYRIFFLGAAEGVAEAAKHELLQRFPAMNIVGCFSPSYGYETDEAENEKIVTMLREAKPDIVFVGVGAPKQEKWIHRYYKEYRAPVSVGIGATFDFLAGTVKRAPRLFQRSGTEWLWRLLQEPRRLWKRYLIEDAQFMKLLINELKKKRREGHGTYSERG